MLIDHSNNPYYSRTNTELLSIKNEEWIKILPREVYNVARCKGTEYSFTGKYWNFDGQGVYYCFVCGNALFRSDAKFISSCGWPSFFKPIRVESVKYKPDNSFGMQRTEVLCGRCDSHLGHVFEDLKGVIKHFCMNSIVLDFEPDTPLESRL